MNLLAEFWPLTVSLFLGMAVITTGIWLLLRYAEQRMTSQGEPSHYRVSRVALYLLTGWAMAAFLLSWAGVFQAQEETVFPFITLGIGVPLIAGYLFLNRSTRLARVLEQIPQHWLIAFQFYRSLGFLFLVLYSVSKLPGVFALPAGIGDVLVGVTAPVVAYIYAAGYKRSCLAVLAWNVIGIADLVLAITLGFLSSPGMFQLLAVDNPNVMITAFPLVLVPTFAVPLSIVLHLASLRILREKVRQLRTAKGDVKGYACARFSKCEA